MQAFESPQERHRRWKLNLLELVRSRPGISRTELKQASGLSMESVLRLVEELLEEQLITGCGVRETGKAGRKASGLQVNPEGSYFIGVRFSAAEVICVCTDFNHTLLECRTRELPAGSDTAVMLDIIIEGISSLMTWLEEKQILVKGIGIGAPGLIDPQNGLIRRYVHVHGCENWPLRRLLEERFSLPVFLEHGVRCSAAAFFRKKNNRELRNALYVQIGRGVNLSILSEGHILNGSGYLSGEIGHMPVGLSNYRCSCGRTGCLETVAGSAALSSLAQRGLLENAHSFPVLRRRVSEASPLQTAAILQAAEDGDQGCRQLLVQAGQAVGIALAAAVMLVNPASIIICSELDSYGPFTAACEASLKANTFPESMEKTTLTFHHSDTLADAMGASFLPYHSLYEVS